GKSSVDIQLIGFYRSCTDTLWFHIPLPDYDSLREHLADAPRAGFQTMWDYDCKGLSLQLWDESQRGDSLAWYVNGTFITNQPGFTLDTALGAPSLTIRQVVMSGYCSDTLHRTIPVPDPARDSVRDRLKGYPEAEF